MNTSLPVAAGACAKHAWAAFVFSLILACAFAGFSPLHALEPPRAEEKKARGNEIRIGEFASLTGREANFGQSSHEGTVLAFEELNAADGVLGRKVVLLTEDNRSKAGESAAAVERLITNKVVAILGEVASSRSLEAAAICQQHGIPMISPSSTNPRVTQTGDFIFRTCFIDPLQGAAMAKFARNTLKAGKALIFIDTRSDYSKSLQKPFEDAFTSGGGSVTSTLKYQGGGKDFRPELNLIKGQAPDVVFLPGYYTDAALICIQAGEQGLKIPILGCDGWESERLVEIGGKAVENNYFSSHYAPEAAGAKGKAFVHAYKKRFDGKEPDVMAALAYDSAIMLFDAIRRAGATEPEKIRDALKTTRDLDAVTGRISINADRDAEKPVVVFRVKNGAFEFVEAVKP